MSVPYHLEATQGLAPRRTASLRFGQRPQTAYGSLEATRSYTLPRSRTRWSFTPMALNHDVLDWNTFSKNQEEAECAIVSPSELVIPRHQTDQAQGQTTSTRPIAHRRRTSQLSQTVKQGFSELKSLGRRMSLTIRSRSSRSNNDASPELHRPALLLPLRSEEEMMDFSEAVSSRPRSRWQFRSPSTRRRPSLPLLTSMQLQPWPMESSVVDVVSAPPRSRGQPLLSDLVYGGDGARASAAAQNERYQASRSTPLPPYSPPKANMRDSESGIGIGSEALSRRASAADRPQPVAHDFFEVLAPELIENILSYLDLKSLLKAGAVSKRWNDFTKSQAIWREIFTRDFSPKQPMPYWEGQVRHLAGMGKSVPGQNYYMLYKVRRQIERRWDDKKVAAIYLNGHHDSVYCLQFDENKIVTGSRDNTIRIWDARTYQCLRKLGPLVCLADQTPQGVDEAGPSGVIPFFRADILSPDPESPPLDVWHDASVLCLQYDDEILVSGSSDYTCLVWDVKDDYKPMFRLRGHTLGVLDVCIDRRYIITCSKDTTIKVWDRNNGQLIKTLLGHRGPVNAVQVRGNLLASASGDGMAKLWRLEDGICVKEFQSRDRGLACVEFSEDGRTIFAGGNDKVIYEYDTVTGQRIRELKGHADLVRSLHLDSANSRIISGSYDQSIKVWDIKKGEPEQDGGLKLNFEGWTSSWMLAAKSNYRKIICTGQDGRVIVMDFGFGIEGVELVEA